MKIGKSQYGIVNLFITLTMIIWFVTGLMAANVLAPYMVPVVIIGTALVSLVILVFFIIAWLKKVKPTKEYEDERSDVCSLKATRNGFVIALIFLAVYMILGQIAPNSLYRIQALQGVYGIAVAAYVISYYYYKQTF